MYPNQQPQTQTYTQQNPPQAQPPHKSSPAIPLFLKLIKIIFVGTIAAIGGSFLETFIQDYFVFDPQSLMSIWVVSFLLALVLRTNYSSIFFVLLLLVATGLVGFYPFSQALVITLLLILLGKLVRLM